MRPVRRRERPATAALRRTDWLAPLAAVLLLAACARTTAAPVETAAHATGLPADAAAVVQRVIDCSHFAGEFGGDGSDRDAEVNATMTALRCDTVEHDAAATRRRYAGDADVIAALDGADAS